MHYSLILLITVVHKAMKIYLCGKIITDKFILVMINFNRCFSITMDSASIEFISISCIRHSCGFCCAAIAGLHHLGYSEESFIEQVNIL